MKILLFHNIFALAIVIHKACYFATTDPNMILLHYDIVPTHTVLT